MKKILIVIVFALAFVVGLPDVLARAEVNTLTCTYKKGDNYLNVVFTGLGDLPYYDSIKFYNGRSGNVYFDTKNNKNVDYVNWNKDANNFSFNDEYYYTVAYIANKQVELGQENYDHTKLCPKKTFIIEDDDSYELYGCGNTVLGVDACPIIKQKVSLEAQDKGSEFYELGYYDATNITTDKNGKHDDAYNKYNEAALAYDHAKEKEKKACEEDSDSTACLEAKEEVIKAKVKLDATTSGAVDSGVSEEKLSSNYAVFKSNFDFNYKEDDACKSLLGSIIDKSAPAYYLNFAFNLMKYLAIVLLFVLSVVEFVKAVASSNQDALKKALQTSIKRIIIAVVIFFLPVLLNLIFELLGWVSDPTCGIGGV